jgi:hypothetical protein
MATATGKDTVDLGWLAWKDPRSWMEPMQGARWKGVMYAENKRFEAAIRGVAGKEALEAAVSAFEAAAQEGDGVRSWEVEGGGSRIRILPHGSSGIEWFWAGGEAEGIDAGDISLGSGGLVAYTREFGHGAESYELIVQRGRRRLWSSRGARGLGFGPAVAIVGGQVIVQEASRPLNYSRVVAFDLGSGGRERVLLHEEPTDSPWMLSLVKGESECLFLVAEQAGRQRLYVLERAWGGGRSGAAGWRLRQLCPEGICFHPLGFFGGGSAPCFFVRRGRMDAPWELEGGAEFQRWRIPSTLRGHGIELAVGGLGLIVFKAHGERIFWRAGGGGAVTRLLCEVALNPWARWAGKGGAGDFLVTVPGAAPVRASIQLASSKGGLHLDYPASEYGGRRATGMARSADGARVRWILLRDANRGSEQPPAGLLVAAYGAYGLPTLMDTGRWKPYLERGWAVGLALVRGGGDDNEVWAEAGRREGKLRGVEDLEACVRAMQGAAGVGVGETVVFGRSAGGYLVGAAIVRHPMGDLFGGAYVEVPYVDVLRTASNPSLPLTAFEYLEFGDPARRLADFEFLLRHSPISGLGAEGAPGVRVLCRTALNDKQVYAYESAKWMDALRGAAAVEAVAEGQPKLLAITAGHGHFVKGHLRDIERAEDYLLIMKNLGSK